MPSVLIAALPTSNFSKPVLPVNAQFLPKPTSTHHHKLLVQDRLLLPPELLLLQRLFQPLPLPLLLQLPDKFEAQMSQIS